PAEASANAAAELAVLAARLETFQATTADLVPADDVATVLSRITARAGLAVRAPRHLLVVQTTPDAPLHIHHQGFRDEDAERVAAEDRKSTRLNSSHLPYTTLFRSSWQHDSRPFRRPRPTWSPPMMWRRCYPASPLVPALPCAHPATCWSCRPLPMRRCTFTTKAFATRTPSESQRKIGRAHV